MGLEFKVYLTCRLLCRGVVRFVSQPSGKNRQVEKKKKLMREKLKDVDHEISYNCTAVTP